MHIGSILHNMSDIGLTTGDFTEESEPFALFATWLKDAEASEINDPNAVALATVDADGLPNVRMVLLKGFDVRGFVFYTNFESQKGQEILGQKKAAMCFHWKSLRRQIRIEGPLTEVTPERADAYFHSRPYKSQVGSAASDHKQGDHQNDDHQHLLAFGLLLGRSGGCIGRHGADSLLCSAAQSCPTRQ